MSDADWSNPEFVLGAVLAQVENLTVAERLDVLFAAISAVAGGDGETTHRLWTGVLRDGQEVLVQLWDGATSHAEVAFRAAPDTTIVWGPPTKLTEQTRR